MESLNLQILTKKNINFVMIEKAPLKNVLLLDYFDVTPPFSFATRPTTLSNSFRDARVPTFLLFAAGI